MKGKNEGTMNSRTILFTTRAGTPIHKLWRNFLHAPPAGFKYVDCEGKALTLSSTLQRSDVNKGMMMLYEIKRHSAWLVMKYKFREEKEYSARVDNVHTDLVYCINGRLYHGEKPWIVDFENPSSFFGFNAKAIKKYKNEVKEILARGNCKAILAYSKTGRKSFLKLFGGEFNDKVLIVPNSIDLPSKTAQQKHRGFNILFTGSSNIDDNFNGRGGKEAVRAFLQASEKRPSMKLIMRCMVPPEERMLLKGKNVEIHDQLLSKKEFERLFLESDIYLLPAYIGYALSSIEAMSYGLPIITSNLLDNGDFVKQGVNGFKVKPPKIEFAEPLIPKYYFDKHIRLKISQAYINRIAGALIFAYDHPEQLRNIRKQNMQEAMHYSIQEKNRHLKKIYRKAINIR